MSAPPSSNGRLLFYLPRTRSALLVLCLPTALGCGSGGESSGTGEPSATQSRDVEFGRATVTVIDNSLSFCPISGTVFSFHATGPMMTLDAVRSTSLSAGGQSTNFASGLGELRAAVGQEVCASVTAAAWDNNEVCHTIEANTSELTFSLNVSRPTGCMFEIELEANVSTFDPVASCTGSCSHLRDCGRPDEGCVAGCVEDLENAPVEENAICHYATRDWITCLHTAPCVNEPEFFCESSSSGYSAEAALFSSGQCVRPLPPPPPLPDPLACDPTQTDLVAGTVGDFVVVGMTSDYPAKHYLIVDLSQLGEVDEVLAASPNDPILAAARTILPNLRALDGSLRDQCNEVGKVAIRFEIDIDIARSLYANLDNQLVGLQASLESLASLAAEAKKQAVAFIFDEIFCPATGTLFSALKPPYDVIAGTAAQASIGCFD